MMGSLSSCDPGNIFNTIDVCKREKNNIKDGLSSSNTAYSSTLVDDCWCASCDRILNFFYLLPQELVKQSVRCSVVGLAAEVRLCKTITQKTGGMSA